MPSWRCAQGTFDHSDLWKAMAFICLQTNLSASVQSMEQFLQLTFSLRPAVSCHLKDIVATEKDKLIPILTFCQLFQSLVLPLTYGLTRRQCCIHYRDHPVHWFALVRFIAGLGHPFSRGKAHGWMHQNKCETSAGGVQGMARRQRLHYRQCLQYVSSVSWRMAGMCLSQFKPCAVAWFAEIVWRVSWWLRSPC